MSKPAKRTKTHNGGSPLFAVLIGILIIGMPLVWFLYISPSKTYSLAQGAMAEKHYQAAQELFLDISWFKDSKEQAVIAEGCLYLEETASDYFLDAIVSEFMSFEYGPQFARQTVTVKKEEITDFQVLAWESSGAEGCASFSFVLNKARAVFSVDVDIAHSYEEDGGWKIESVSCRPQATYVDISGSWDGWYNANQGDTALHLTVQEPDEDGFYEATFYFSPLPENPGVKSGSYYMSGYIDYNNLTLGMTGEEWIELPDSDYGEYEIAGIFGWSTWDFFNLDGYYCVEDDMLYGVSDCVFEAQRLEEQNN